LSRNDPVKQDANRQGNKNFPAARLEHLGKFAWLKHTVLRFTNCHERCEHKSTAIVSKSEEEEYWQK
jgi:hypothetical protein